MSIVPKIIIDNIPWDFFPSSEGIVFLRENQLIEKRFNNEESILFEESEKFILLDVLSDFIFLRTKDNFITLSRKESKTYTFSLEQFENVQYKYHYKNLIILRCLVSNTWKVYCFSIFGKLVWDILYEEPFFVNCNSIENCFLYGFNNKITSCDLSNGNINWTIDLRSTFPEIEKIDNFNSSCFYSNKIFQLCRTEHDVFTIIIDANTGSLLVKLDEIKGAVKNFQNSLYFSKGFYTYGRINPSNYDIELLDFQLSLEPLNILISHSNYHVTENGLMLFVDGSRMASNKLCLLELDSGELLHVEEYSRDVVIRDLRILESLILVHTSDNRLYIYSM